MLYRETPPGTFTAWRGEPIDGVRHPPVIEQVWSDQELAAIGLYRPAPAEPVPAGKVSTGLTVQRIAGVIRYVHGLADMALEDLRAARIAAVTARRWQVETAGFLWARPDTAEVYYIATDATSQGKIDAERKAADAGRRRPGDVWKCGDPVTGGVVYPALSDADIVDMSNAARDRVCDCFNREAALVAAVAVAEDAAALDAIDIETGWPG